jgi:hypothetical protein
LQKPLLLAALSLVVGTGQLAAQHDASSAYHEDEHPHQTAFSEGPRSGWTIGAPHLDINGGLFYVSRDPSDTKEAFVRLHAQAALGIPAVELASDLQWIPSFGATPTWSAVGQVAPVRASSRLYLSGGVGVVTGHSSKGDRLKGWMQGVLAVRTPLHEIAPFVQAGRAFGSGQKAEFLFGIAHPLAPYKFHLP